MRLKELQVIADSIGFDAIGVAPVALLSEDGVALQRWIARGDVGEMGYMERNIDKRIDITRLVEGARSVIVTLTSYKSNDRPNDKELNIASYAFGADYHKVVKDKLFLLANKLREEGFVDLEGRCFVDSAPVFEHEWARRAGLGWIGNNTLLINKQLGSFTFIGCLVSNIVFEEYSSPISDSFCGNCSRCVDACPTGALSIHNVDARRCLSYNTIELKDEIPDDILQQARGWIYGCDCCQQVCPWNQRVDEHRHEAFRLTEWLKHRTKAMWLETTEEEFNREMKNSAMKRAGLSKIKNTILRMGHNPNK